MSRLDSFIRRLTAQRTCLDAAVAAIAEKQGPAFELGLGNGRTFDHLRSRMPDREIFVFDRQVAAHPDSTPDAAHMIVGDFTETLPAAVERFGATVMLIHGDIGSGHADVDAALAESLAEPLSHLLAPGGLIVTDQPIPMKRLVALPLPSGVQTGRYHMMRKPG